MNRLSASVLLVCAAAGAWGTVTDAGQQPAFESATHTIPIHATVMDRSGRVVTDLSREDFSVLDDGRSQEVTVFDNGLQPITIVVLLDRSGSVKEHFNLVRDAAKEFVRNMLPGDRVRIGSFADRIRIDPEEFTGSQGELEDILDSRLLPAGGTPLWNATALALDSLMTQSGRRVVLVFTDGRDTPGVGRNVSFEEMLARVQAEETMLYAIGLSQECAPSSRAAGDGTDVLMQAPPVGVQSLPQFPGPRVPFPFPGRGVPIPRPIPQPWDRPVTSCTESRPDPDLRELADEGGGGYFELRSTHDLGATFARVAYELHSQYLLGFTAGAVDGRLHQIEVRVDRPGVVVRARRSYLSPKP